MGEYLGFSRTGTLFLLALLAPNLLWTRYPPRDYDASGEPCRLLLLERVGQVWVTAGALLSPGLNWSGWSPRALWLLSAVGLMVLYELWWLRYFRSGRTMEDFTRGLLGVPVAGATLPVLAFFLLTVYGRVLWMLPGVVILGAGHIGIHLFHRGELHREETM